MVISSGISLTTNTVAHKSIFYIDVIRTASESETDHEALILCEFPPLTDNLQALCRHPGAMIQRSEYLQQLITKSILNAYYF